MAVKSNLLVNGDFEATVLPGFLGFSTQYSLPQTIPIFSEGGTPDPSQPFQPRYFPPQAGQYLIVPATDPDGGISNVMLVDGAVTPDRIVWSESVVDVDGFSPNELRSNTPMDYQFSFLAVDVDSTGDNHALLSVSIDGFELGRFQTTGTWQPFSVTYHSVTVSTSPHNIEIVDINTSAVGNKFELDSLVFGELGTNVINHAPVASNISSNEDVNDSIVELTAAFTDADQSDNFAFSIDTTGTIGAVTNNNDGTFTYDPNGGFDSLALGETAIDTFTYTVTDSHGASSNTATATITIHGEAPSSAALFTAGADVVDFNHLTTAQKQAIDANPLSIYHGLGGNDVVTLPDATHYQLTANVVWDPLQAFLAQDTAGQHYQITGGGGADNIVLGDGDDLIAGSAGNDLITVGPGADTFDFRGFVGLSNDTHQTIVAGGNISSKILLPGSPTDYNVVVHFDNASDPAQTVTTITGNSIFLPSATLALTGIQKAAFEQPIDDSVFGPKVQTYHSEQIYSGDGKLAVEMAELATEDAYLPKAPLHTAFGFPWEDSSVTTGAADAELRGWHAISAIELGMTPAGQQNGLHYSLVRGLYQAVSDTETDTDGDPVEASALVLSGIVNGNKTLAISFTGTDQWSDFLDYTNFQEHYSKFQPLVDAIRPYLGDYDQILVSGHSLGGAMAEYFMHEFAGDPRFHAWTFGSPGIEETKQLDSRITSFVEHGDLVGDLVPKISQLNAEPGSPEYEAALDLISPATKSAVEVLIETILEATPIPPSAVVEAKPKTHSGVDQYLNTEVLSPISYLTELALNRDIFHYHHIYLSDVIALYQTRHAIDGYLSGGTVFSDDNGNGQLDSTESSTTTDSSGSFALSNRTGPFVAFGGIDRSTGLAFKGQLSAPVGSSVITPLTTLMVLLSSDAAAEQKVLSSFGLSSNIDLNSYDPIAAAGAGSADGGLAEIAHAKVYDTVSLIASTLVAAGGDFSSGVKEAFAATAAAIGGSGISLTNEAQVSALIVVTAQSRGLTLGQGVADSVAPIITASNILLDHQAQSGATGEALLNAIAAIERVIQGTASNAIQQAGNDADQLQALVTAFSGDRLDDAVSTALSHLGVSDTTAPTLTPVADQTNEGTSAAGAAAFFIATASDNVDGTIPVVFKEDNKVVHSGDVFGLGSHTITASAIDAAGNQTFENFKFNVVDTTAPTLTPVPDHTLEAANAAGAAAFFTATATDAVDGPDVVVFKDGNNVIQSGDIFSLGNHIITATTIDAAGNLVSESFTINVKDTMAPTLTPVADQTVQATTNAGATAFFAATATDLVDGTDPVVFKEGNTVVHSGDIFGLGIHTIAASSVDAVGNSASETFKLSVIGATSHNHDPVALNDSNGVTKCKTLSVSASKGVLANDSDTDHDHLSVGAVNGSGANVGHSVKGEYGNLSLNADGSYSYAATAKALPSQIFAEDTFTYTTVDGHGGSDTSTLTLAVFDPSFTYKAGLNTILWGGNGKDVLDGSAGHDVVYGGNGADVLIGGKGDILAGGKGPDHFVFRPDFGVNTIVDFDVKNDHLQFDHSTFDSIRSILDHTTNTPLGAMISDGHGDTVLLLGVNKPQLLAHSGDLLIA